MHQQFGKMAAIIEGRFGFRFSLVKISVEFIPDFWFIFGAFEIPIFPKALCVFQWKSLIDIWKEIQNVPMKFRLWWIFWKPATAHNSAPSAILGILEGWSFGFLCNFAVGWKISVTNPKLRLCAKRYALLPFGPFAAALFECWITIWINCCFCFSINSLEKWPRLSKGVLAFHFSLVKISVEFIPVFWFIFGAFEILIFPKALCVFQLKSRMDIWKESQNVPMKFRF